MSKLTHVDHDGRASMVDVSSKRVTARIAGASGSVSMKPETVEKLRHSINPKGDPLETARLAGIMAAKNTASLIPLCHPLLIDHVDVTATLTDTGVQISSSITVTGRTGAEMEALTAVSVSALTIYDMCKAVDKEMIIGEIRLEKKSGGKSGNYTRGIETDD